MVIGASGSGKSTLVNCLVESHPPPNLFGCWVGDDRLHADWHNDILVVRPAATLEGLFERYYSGIESVNFIGSACIDIVVELIDSPPRLPESASLFWENTRVPSIKVPSRNVEVSASLVTNCLVRLDSSIE